MIISLILGVVLGAVLVIFVLQNVAIVTVSFITWQLTGSLALVLLASIISGVVITLLILLPSLIRDDFRLASLKKQKKEVDDELARTKATLNDANLRTQTASPASTSGTQTITTVEKTSF
jgi:putative membrane protein